MQPAPATMQLAPGFSFHVQAAIRYDKEADCWVSFCPQFDLYSAGKSEEHAINAIVSTIRLFVAYCFERKILEGYLADKGICLVMQGHDLHKQDWASVLACFGGELQNVDVNIPWRIGTRAWRASIVEDDYN